MKGFLAIVLFVVIALAASGVTAECEGERCDPTPTPTPDPCAGIECDPAWCENPELCTHREHDCCCEGPPTAVDVTTFEARAGAAVINALAVVGCALLFFGGLTFVVQRGMK